MHDDWPDDAVYRGLVRHDARALEALIHRYTREISYFIRLLLDGIGTPQDVDECANDLFLTVWQDIESFDPARGSLRTWLTMRAKYIALDRRRHIQRRQIACTSLDASEPYGTGKSEGRQLDVPASLLADGNMEGMLEQRERREDLARALSSLAELDRTVVILRYFRLASTEEIANKTGLTRHAIDTRLWRARKQLREVLEERIHGQVRAREDARP